MKMHLGLELKCWPDQLVHLHAYVLRLFTLAANLLKHQGAFPIDPTPKIRQGLWKFTLSRPQSYTIFASISHFSTPTFHRSHTGMQQNFKTHVKDLQCNPYKMQPGLNIVEKKLWKLQYYIVQVRDDSLTLNCLLLLLLLLFVCLFLIHWIKRTIFFRIKPYLMSTVSMR